MVSVQKAAIVKHNNFSKWKITLNVSEEKSYENHCQR